MTASHPPATWADIEAFCQADGWSEDRSTDHVFWEKTLPTGEVLKTHRSFSAKDELGPNLFRLILREQLGVSRDEFWRTIRTGQPVERPVETDEAPPTYPAWVVFGLRKYGYDEERIRRELTPEQAQDLLEEKWSGQEP